LASANLALAAAALRARGNTGMPRLPMRDVATPRALSTTGATRPPPKAAVLRIVDSDTAAWRRDAPAIRRHTRGPAMATIDALTPAQRLALARFIETNLRLRGSMHWRTAFYECTRRGHFYPYATTEETNHLMRLAHDFGPLIVCQFKTADLREAVPLPVA
jgi:hypothetical protein